MKAKPAAISLLFLFSLAAVEGQNYPGQPKWNPFDIGVSVDGSPAFAPGGSPIYVTAEDGNLYAINPATGTAAANWPQGGVSVLATGSSREELLCSPAVDKNGNIYIAATLDNTLKIVSPAGVIIQSVPLGSSARPGGVAFGPNGMVYVTFDDDYNLYAINASNPATAFVQWTLDVGFHADSPPTVGLDGTIYFFGANENLYSETLFAVVDESCQGGIKWSNALGFGEDQNDLQSSLVVDNSGHIYCPFGTNSTGLIAFNTTNGSTVAGAWPFFTPTAQPILDSPAIGTNGTIYFGASDGIFYALNTNGTLKWKFNTENTSPIRSSPAVAADGTIAFGTDQGRLWDIADAGFEGYLKWNYPDMLHDPPLQGVVLSSPLIGADNAIYFGCGDGNVYSIFGSAPLTNTASPMYRGNAQHAVTPTNSDINPAWWINTAVTLVTNIYKGYTGVGFPKGGETTFSITRSSCTASLNSPLSVTFFLGGNGTALSSTNFDYLPGYAYYQLDFTETGANRAPFPNGFFVTFAPGQSQITVTVNTVDSPSEMPVQLLMLSIPPSGNLYQPGSPPALVFEWPDPNRGD